MPDTNEPETATPDATCPKIAGTEKKDHHGIMGVGALSLAGGMLVREAGNGGADGDTEAEEARADDGVDHSHGAGDETDAIAVRAKRKGRGSREG